MSMRLKDLPVIVAVSTTPDAWTEHHGTVSLNQGTPAASKETYQLRCRGLFLPRGSESGNLLRIGNCTVLGWVLLRKLVPSFQAKTVLAVIVVMCQGQRSARLQRSHDHHYHC